METDWRIANSWHWSVILTHEIGIRRERDSLFREKAGVGGRRRARELYYLLSIPSAMSYDGCLMWNTSVILMTALRCIIIPFCRWSDRLNKLLVVSQTACGRTRGQTSVTLKLPSFHYTKAEMGVAMSPRIQLPMCHHRWAQCPWWNLVKLHSGGIGRAHLKASSVFFRCPSWTSLFRLVFTTHILSHV